MIYEPVNCEATVKIYNKKDCAYHDMLGWSQTEWHTHKKGQLIYGEYSGIRVYSRHEIFYIPSRHFMWIPAGMEHKVITESNRYEFHSLYLDCEGLTDPFYYRPNLCFSDPLLREMILYTERFDLDSPPTAHERSFFEAIKLMLPRYANRSIGLKLPVSDHPLLQQIIQYISDHLDEKLSAPELARSFGLSDRTMLRLFQKELSISYSQYLKLIRISRAVELLMQPGSNVSEVAFAVGYESLPTFSNNFKEIMGARPNLFLCREIRLTAALMNN